MLVIGKGVSETDLRKMVMENLGTGKLIMCDYDARAIGRTRVLSQIAAIMNIPLIVRNTTVQHMILRNFTASGITIDVFTPKQLERIRKCNAKEFLADEISLEDINRIACETRCSLSTGFFYNNNIFVTEAKIEID